MTKTYLVIVQSYGMRDGIQNYGNDLETAKKQVDHYRDNSRFQHLVRDASVYEASTNWSEDRSYATANYKKVY